MRNQETKALGCMWLFGSLVLSIFVPMLLSDSNITSDVAWVIFAPGWKLFPFGFDDFPHMLLAFSVNIIIYPAVTYAAFRLVVLLVARRKKYS